MIHRRLIAALALLALTALAAGPVGAGQTLDRQQALRFVADMRAAYAGVADYTAVFKKTCAVAGSQCPTETTALKFKKPQSVYLRWTGPVRPGQEVIYVAGRNGGQLRAHKGSFPDLTLNLDPAGAVAMECNRRSVNQLGLGSVIELLASALAQNPAAALGLDGPLDVAGRACRCLTIAGQAAGPGEPVKARVCRDEQNRLPLRATMWDADGKLVEDYEFSRLQTNVGLTERDFDPDNHAYDF